MSPTRPSTARNARGSSPTVGTSTLSTAPYLSFAGAHLPRLKVPVPLHLIVGRPIAFATFQFLARHATWTLREPANENSFIKAARRGEVKHDDLLEKVRVQRLRAQIAAAGLRIVREELHATATVRRLPAALGRWLKDSPLTQDALISNMEYVYWRGLTGSGRHRSLPAGRPARRRGAVSPRVRPRRRRREPAALGVAVPPEPQQPGREPEIWIAREGPAIVGQYATMPVRLSLAGQEVQGSWGMDVMVAPERQRQGLGELLFRTWDRNVGASLGLGLSESSYRLFQKLRWPDVGPIPMLVKPLTRRAFRRRTGPSV